jgi:molybdate transport system permease protein
VDAVQKQRSSSPRNGEGWLVAASLPLLVFLALPVAALLLRTPLAEVPQTLRDPLALQAMRLSLVTSTTATVLAVLLGLPLAYLLARRKFRGRALVDTLVDLPMVLPPAVAGLALLMAFGRRGLLGAPLTFLGVEIVFTPVAVVLAQLFVASPFFVKAAVSGFSAVAHDLEEAARLDGADSLQVFRFVTLPLARNTLFSGAAMTWARALGEFGATIIFAGNYPGRTQTMPLAIYLGIELDINLALTLSVLLLGTAFLVLLVVKRVLHGQIAAVQQ